MLAPRPDADERRAIGIGQDLPCLPDVDDQVRALRDCRAELRHRDGLARRRLDRVAFPDPPVVPTVEKAHVIDARVAQDQRGAGGGDLPGPAPRPLLVRVTLGVAPVEDHGRIGRDPERPQRMIKLGGRPAIPVGRRLEPVGVEIVGARDVSVGVLLGDPEVHVEEHVAGRRGGLRPLSCEHSLQPGDVHQLVVVRQALDRQALVARPRGPAGVIGVHVLETTREEVTGERDRVDGPVAVDHDGTAGLNALRSEEAFDLGRIHGSQPIPRERHSARDMAAADLASEAPAVVRGQRAHVDDRQGRFAQPIAKLVGRNCQAVPLLNDVECTHRWSLWIVVLRSNKKPRSDRAGVTVGAARFVRRDPRSWTPSALPGNGATRTADADACRVVHLARHCATYISD